MNPVPRNGRKTFFSTIFHFVFGRVEREICFSPLQRRLFIEHSEFLSHSLDLIISHNFNHDFSLNSFKNVHQHIERPATNTSESEKFFLVLFFAFRIFAHFWDLENVGAGFWRTAGGSPLIDWLRSKRAMFHWRPETSHGGNDESSEFVAWGGSRESLNRFRTRLSLPSALETWTLTLPAAH